jgi:PEP-CTERM motif
MRKLLSSVVVVACGVLLAGSVSAAPLVSASFSFQLGALPAANFPGSGATGTAISQLSASLGAGSVFNGQFTTTLPTSAAPPLTAIQVILTKNAGNTFVGATPANVGGNLAIEGVANVYGIGGFPNGGAPLLPVPLKVGTPNTIFKSGGGVAVTAIAAGWTAGTAVVTGITTTPTTTTATNPDGSATLMGANGLAGDGSGTLVLVTPIKILTNVAGNLAAFSTLTLTYVPEPGTLLLLGMGVSGLAALGRRRS